ncbi:MAG: WxcM-like domain-containing protein [bacterium]|nr:WxcM-like domain-containing protein [bacterium]
MLEQIRREPCKKVATADAHGEPNGFLVELYKDGPKTLLYLTAAYPKAFKGYHLHTVRASHYVCLKGTMKITVVEGTRKVEHILDGQQPERLLLPTNVWIGLENIGEEEAWLINFPNPPYDPDLKGEQQDKTPDEIERQLRGR